MRMPLYFWRAWVSDVEKSFTICAKVTNPSGGSGASEAWLRPATTEAHKSAKERVMVFISVTKHGACGRIAQR
jgi:hypothetical protein